ncbi:hypothetical protein [Parachlamydia sp. AcF125]|uniref:hypothetical protein n=1 Tax=Parachlamydia sp. AcF125 TaxID=2795736 RepID=UPI001BCA213C|nr:hypothetical protein [Parachlamydia sp. AcF125]MBS4167511.1 hypothetical protein [Parachlamydia sp. AcF125]
MKKLAVLSLSLLTVCAHAFAASADFPIGSKPWENFNQDLRVVNIYNLKDCELNEIMQGHRPEIAVEFTAQTKLPINFFLKGDLLNLQASEEKFGTIEIKQTFYARSIGQELILSLNLADWKPFLEFITGTASAALSIQDGQPSIVVGAEANQRS